MNILEDVVDYELNKKDIEVRMTGFLVKKQKRGTYQALTESKEIIAEINNDLKDYILNWFNDSLLSGEVRELLKRELNTQLFVELARRGFHNI